MRTVAQSPGILPAVHTGGEAAAGASFGKHLLLTLFFLTIVLDFRRIEGDENPFVVVMGIANVLLGAWYCVAYGRFTTRLFCWVAPFLLLIGAGTLSGILYGQETYLVLSTAIPMVSFLLAAIAVHAIDGEEEKRIAVGIILATAFMAAAAKFAFGFYYYEVDFENVRYQIISGSVPLLFAYGFAGIFSRGQKFALTAIFVAVLIVVVSVTRTYIIVFGLSALVCLYSYSKAASRVTGFLVIAIVVAVLGVALVELVPGILGRWNDRITSSEFGVDLSAAYRVAEAEYQLRRLWADGTGLLLGFGHAAKTGLAGDNVRLIASELGRHATGYYSFGYGHNVYVGLIYVGGIVAGVPVMGALFYLLWKGLQRARQTAATPLDQFLLIWGVAAFAGYMANGMLAGTFGNRSISFFCGVSAGLVLLGLEPARHAVREVARRGAEAAGDMRTPKQRRAALAAGRRSEIQTAAMDSAPG